MQGPSRRRSLRPLIGLSATFVIGLLYGYAVTRPMIDRFHDLHQPSPGMAAGGVGWLGILVGLLVLPLVAGVAYRLAIRYASLRASYGCALAAAVTAIGAIAGFLFGATIDWHV